MGHRLLALVEARALVVVPFCHHELVLVLVARQPGCHISKTLVVADACWPSAEDHVSLLFPFVTLTFVRGWEIFSLSCTLVEGWNVFFKGIVALMHRINSGLL